MSTFQGQFHILVFRAGILSALGHDLRLRAQAAALEVKGESIVATVRTDSLKVVTALRDGKPLPGALSASDNSQIEKIITDEVLMSRRYPEARLEAKTRQAGEGVLMVEGTLSIRGRKGPVRFPVEQVEGRCSGRFEIRQTQWGIKPYKALLGGLAVQDRVCFEFEGLVSD